MHQNDLKCGDLVDFVASKSHFVLYESEFFFFGGGGRRSGLILGILFRKQNMGSDEVKWT